MARYIDADALIKEAEKESNQDGAYGYMDTKSIVDLINDAPTADVVEVVRCKDCKHYEHELPGMVFCPNIIAGWTPFDFFCADGERRDDAETH